MLSKITKSDEIQRAVTLVKYIDDNVRLLYYFRYPRHSWRPLSCKDYKEIGCQEIRLDSSGSGQGPLADCS
jgi:hypothetical protein